MASPPHTPEQAGPVTFVKGRVRIDPKVLAKITPAMLRAVEGRAMDRMVHEIAADENVSIHCINRWLAKTRKLLHVYSTIAAYRLLTLARILKRR